MFRGALIRAMLVPLQTGIGLQIAVLVVALVVLYGAFRLIKTLKPFVINAVLGLLLITLAGVFGFGVQITPVLILLVAFGGLPAAVLAIVLAKIGIVFEPAVIVPMVL
jgi:hypothetical protein